MRNGRALIALCAGNICWVTQVVVHQNFRGLGIATRLLNKIKTDGDAVFGMISSHPAALMALSRIASGCSPSTLSGKSYTVPADTRNFLGNSISNINLEFIKKHASQVLGGSNIDYLYSTKLHGSLFAALNTTSSGEDADEDEDDGTICCVETEFFMEHEEALQALDYLENCRGERWPLGDLLEGVEFVLLVENMDHVMAKKGPRI